jgi:hypothetical protein
MDAAEALSNRFLLSEQTDLSNPLEIWALIMRRKMRSLNGTASATELKWMLSTCGDASLLLTTHDEEEIRSVQDRREDLTWREEAAVERIPGWSWSPYVFPVEKELPEVREKLADFSGVEAVDPRLFFGSE